MIRTEHTTAAASWTDFNKKNSCIVHRYRQFTKTGWHSNGPTNSLHPLPASVGDNNTLTFIYCKDSIYIVTGQIQYNLVTNK